MTQLRVRLTACFMLALATATPTAFADDWSAGTGDWFTDSNWLDGSAPMAADDVTIDNGGTAQVQAPGAVATDLFVGVTDGNSGFLEITAGGTVSNTAGRIGVTTGSTGTATVDGAGSAWTNSGVLEVGYEGDGTLAITGGGAVSNTLGTIGFEPGSTGTATVDGADSAWTNIDSYLIVGGLDAATGTLAITDGGAVSNTIGFIGFNPGSTGTVTVDGPGSVWTSSAGVGVGDMGTGTLAITGGGAVSTTVGSIGHSQDSSGTATVDGPGSTWTGSDELFVGYYSVGSLAITNGGAVSNALGVLGRYPIATGTATVDGAGSAWTNSDGLLVGQAGTGTLDITDGGAVNSATGSIGLLEDSSGAVTVDGAGSAWTNSGGLSVGGGLFEDDDERGNGTLTITGGGAVSNTFGVIGGGICCSTGTATVDGAGSTWTNSGDLFVGRGALSNGTLAITNGGAVSSLNGYIPDRPGTGTATVDGAGSTWTISGDLFVGRRNNGTGTLTITDDGAVNVAGAFWLGREGGTTGTLNIGAGGAAGILNAATVKGGNGAATLNFNHTDTDYFFTNDGTAGGTAIAIGVTTAVNQLGTGTTILTGANTHRGATTIDAGVLRVDGSMTPSATGASSATTVNSGGTLSGDGTVAGVTVADGGTIAPGASAGTLTTGDLTLNANSLLDFELDTPGVVGSGVNDLIVVDGNLVLDGVVEVTDLGDFGAGTYTLLTYTGTLTDGGLTLGSLPPWAGAVQIDTATAGEVRLLVAPAPVLALSVSGLDFGDALVNTQSAAQTVTAENTGSADLDIGLLAVSGTHAADFALADDTCSNQTIAPAATCTFDVTMVPSAVGARGAQVDVPSNAPSTPDTVTLTGAGIEDLVFADGFED